MLSPPIFDSEWPDVLVEIKNYVADYLVVIHHWQQLEIQVFFSRQLVRADQLQPHVSQLRQELEKIPNSQVKFKSTDHPSHQVKINYWR